MSNNQYIRKDGTLFVEYNGKLLEVGKRLTWYNPKGYSNGPNTDLGTLWSIFGVEDNKLLITPYKLYVNIELKGKEGFEDGINKLNNAVKDIYMDKYFAETVRSINVDDINLLSNYNPEKNTAYSYCVNDYQPIRFIHFWDRLLGTQKFWIGTQYKNFSIDKGRIPSCGLYYMWTKKTRINYDGNHSVLNVDLFDENGYYGRKFFVRPVIILKEGVEVYLDCFDNYYDLKL